MSGFTSLFKNGCFRIFVLQFSIHIADQLYTIDFTPNLSGKTKTPLL
ncbi:hypothetical protein HMPREF0519_0868 [Lentilactobacillus hilgardii DSM 20176 = ATCC 8290]|uniref:Uncharacterized protein n=1 Tax=Lentilactobacillus hilgardii (strain ATCC 8290 / DSM 20176 / CCUG 30140 / JCM 1155 / KCTC 3500 / NBRC 15886 / NCIMB 8040 / NRRL B-1843 / 9) TaxID=1423757 RepID=C0XI07_LENH9|nr:hypothetical protein HMPREF0519_0868 [Lentilactobacillus hilgardii DSM 20176 = ATCC 8290]